MTKSNEQQTTPAPTAETWPKKFTAFGTTCEAHAPWCPCDQMREAAGGRHGGLFMHESLWPKCRCHLRPVEAKP